MPATPHHGHSFVRTGSLILLATGPAAAMPREWEAFVELCREDLRHQGPAALAILYSPAWAPTIAQRDYFARSLRREDMHDRFAMVSGSRLLRAAIVALRWRMAVHTQVRAFPLGCEHEALSWLSAHAHFDLASARQLLATCAKDVGLGPP